MNPEALQNLVIQTLVDDQKIMREEIQSLKALCIALQQPAEPVAPALEQEEPVVELEPKQAQPTECCTCQSKKRKREVLEEAENEPEVAPNAKKTKFSNVALSFLGQSVTTLLWFAAYEVFSAYDLPKL